ncbi:hypothetical protein EDB19DRAFT_1732540 [Suillus lakei]|nr:hypothetical protein EDB19DRAFT_1732540 [Suillus lakei]
MVRNPHLFRRAPPELDDVLGSGAGSGQASKAKRLPTLEGRAMLPHCDAMFTETLRWGAPVLLRRWSCGDSAIVDRVCDRKCGYDWDVDGNEGVGRRMRKEILGHLDYLGGGECEL